MQLGIIEGFYGKPWTFAERADGVARLAPHGYGFYIYAPKSDVYLRRRWMDDHPDEVATQLRELSRACRALGVRFGVGLSPFELYWNFDRAGGDALRRKIAGLDAIGIDDLAILFDDMRGEFPALARAQAEVVAFAAEHTSASRIIMCPTYYTDDPVLDRFYGQRPANYLSELGELLDPRIEIFWTGPEVCSREFSAGHLARVAEHLRRRPVLWDNYPVNDGPRMSRHLHLRAFTGRPASIAPHISAHAINPASQPTLSRIPALTLAESYAVGDLYDYGQAFARAANESLGVELASLVAGDMSLLQDAGLDSPEERFDELRARYAAFDHPGAREIVSWLDGHWHITRKEMGDA